MRGERRGPAPLVALELLWGMNTLAQLKHIRAQKDTDSQGGGVKLREPSVRQK